MLKKQGLLLVFFLYGTLLFSQTKLPSFFGNNMVLQQNEKVAIWGEDKPNTKIKIMGSWGEKSSTETDANGKWQVKLQTPKAGGPYTLKIKGSQNVTLKNVLIGEVWICSGQSNMEMPLKGKVNEPIIGSLETILNSKNSQLRFFHVKKDASLIPLDDVSGTWQETSPETASNFSATAYYYGKKIQAILGVPVGLIHASWGSSTAEAWTDKETLSQFESVVIPKEIPKKMKQQVPTLLYNAMLHPFIGYNMKGVIWYQGESNKLRANEYQELVTKMVSS
ncbi:sialate O-acetylesterase [Polaribacter pectinis]|uniref:sialate O-acetylesterase n=1 Tax=Polaribacter pectinis TaxID=2738844 RepID=UPI0020C772E2|nr:sialate O-acetylesterase [Polaribacter pectinis]